MSSLSFDNMAAKWIRNFYLITIVILLENSITISYQIGKNHRINKRMNLELCSGRFDIHRDTIIRTEESQAIGGKFLQGLALETIVECQRLCCETNDCDVFIFEDKVESYCYLFECGPPTDFRCRFTRHSNYTSAVLEPVRQHIATPASPTAKSPQQPSIAAHQKLPPPSLSQHERELTNLKQNKIENNDVTAMRQRQPGQEQRIQLRIRVSTTNMPSIGSRINGETQQFTTAKSPGNSSACGRFQFQCHSGECIAVYNACDGIPQCEDGSDEGPECPPSSSSGLKSESAVKYNETPLQNNRVSPDTMQIMSKSPVQNFPRQYQQQQQHQMIPNSILSGNNREDSIPGTQIWINHNKPNLQNDMVPHKSHIFNHKGGIQITSDNLGQQYLGQNIVNGMYNNPMQHEMYMSQADIQQNPYRNAIIQPSDHMMIAPNIPNWQQQQTIPDQQALSPANSYVISVNGEPVPQVKPISQQDTILQQQNNVQQIQNSDSVKKDSVVAPSLIQTTVSTKGRHNNREGEENDGKVVSGEVEENSSDEYKDYSENKSTEAPKKKQRKHKKLNKDKSNKQKESKHQNNDTEEQQQISVHEKYKMLKDDLEMEFVDHDGQSERPGGAVLSLTLGVIVTAALAILIGCRMRTVSRRVRRLGKAPYAHEADFLVNGMYL